MSAQSFTRNHRDHSNDVGFQFEFFCDKCGNGYRSSFKNSAVGFAASIAKAAGALLGGSAYRVGWGADHVKDALRGPAWDAAFKEAVEELRPKFHQCTLCGRWVCPDVCWNKDRSLCEECAPDLREHAPKIQAQVAVEQAWDQARSADQLRGFDVNAGPLAAPAASAANPAAVAALSTSACAKCSTALPSGARFCAGCGTPVAEVSAASNRRFCVGCGQQLQAGARFCAGCGTAAG